MSDDNRCKNCGSDMKFNPCCGRAEALSLLLGEDSKEIADLREANGVQVRTMAGLVERLEAAERELDEEKDRRLCIETGAGNLQRAFEAVNTFDARTLALQLQTTKAESARLREALRLAVEKIERLEGAALLGTLREKIVEWGDATFPNSTEATVLAHLKDEVEKELLVGCDPEEIADVAMLTLQLAHKRGVDIAAVLHAKLAKNMARKWKFDPVAGFSRHVKDDAALGGSDPR